MLRHHLLILLLLLAPTASVAEEETTSSGVTAEIVLRAKSALPPDLQPRIIQGQEQAARLLSDMQFRTNSKHVTTEPLTGLLLAQRQDGVFSANTAPGTYYLVLSHPGFLRAFKSKPVSFSRGMQRQIVDLPTTGGILAYVSGPSALDTMDGEKRREIEQRYCVGVSVSGPHKIRFDDGQPLKDWKVEYLDLPPGTYEMHGIGRWFDSRSGPAGYAGSARIDVKPDKVTQFQLDMWRRRHEFTAAEKSGELPQIIK